MRILFIVPYMPNLVRVRSYQFIRSLTKRGHELTVATLWTNTAEKQAMSALEAQCQEVIAFPMGKARSFGNCLGVLLGNEPLQSVYSWQPRMALALRERVHGNHGKSEFDIVHVEHLRGVRYGLEINSKRFGNKQPQPVVWDSVDSISHLFRQSAQYSRSQIYRWITRFELKRTQRYETWLLSQFKRIVVTSPIDKEAFLSLAENNPGKLAVKTTPENIDHRIAVVPNGVDLDYFTPGKFEDRQPDTIVLSGKMSYHANISMAIFFAEQIFPLVLARHPQARLVIVGKDPSKAVKDLARNSAIQVTGEVQDIRPYIQKAAVAVAPVVYGAGIQNKVLEAMACATPVVASPQAVSALNTRAGIDLEVAESPEKMAAIILELLKEPQRRQALAEGGRRFVEGHHTWDGAAASLEKAYEEAIRAATHRQG